MFRFLQKNVFSTGSINRTSFFMKRSMVQTQCIPQYSDYNNSKVTQDFTPPIGVTAGVTQDFTPPIGVTTPQINIEYIIECCEAGCEKCPISPNYNQKSINCCGRDCVYCGYFNN